MKNQTWQCTELSLHIPQVVVVVVVALSILDWGRKFPYSVRWTGHHLQQRLHLPALWKFVGLFLQGKTKIIHHLLSSGLFFVVDVLFCTMVSGKRWVVSAPPSCGLAFRTGLSIPSFPLFWLATPYWLIKMLHSFSRGALIGYILTNHNRFINPILWFDWSNGWQFLQLSRLPDRAKLRVESGFARCQSGWQILNGFGYTHTVLKWLNYKNIDSVVMIHEIASMK